MASKPLTEASKSAKFRAVMDLSAERVILGRSAIIAGWSVGVVGTLMLGASIYGWVTILPLKTIQNEIWVADKTTGIISHPVSLQDAARTFGAATERNYLRQYVEARVGYLKQMDKENDHLVKIMSSKDEQSHYEAERQDPNGPIKRLGKDEYAKIINLRYFLRHSPRTEPPASTSCTSRTKPGTRGIRPPTSHGRRQSRSSSIQSCRCIPTIGTRTPVGSRPSASA
jgi:type IV secretory pathway component VirB8